MKETHTYSDYAKTYPGRSRILPGLDYSIEDFRCPRCMAELSPLEHGTETVCPDCGLSMTRWGDSLELSVSDPVEERGITDACHVYVVLAESDGTPDAAAVFVSPTDAVDAARRLIETGHTYEEASIPQEHWGDEDAPGFIFHAVLLGGMLEIGSSMPPRWVRVLRRELVGSAEVWRP